MERVVRVLDNGIHDADRWLRLERVSRSTVKLELYDLALPRSKQMFFAIDFDAYLLDLAVGGCYARMSLEGNSCSFSSEGSEIILAFKPASWPMEEKWTIPRSDFVAAVCF